MSVTETHGSSDKVAILDDGSMVELFASEDPSVWFALSSDGRTKYRITGVWTANPHCHCPARKQECRHLKGVIYMVLEENAMAEQSTALVPAQSAAVAAGNNANNALLAIRGQVESYKYALEFCDMYAAEAQIPEKFGKNKATMAAVLLRGVELGLPFGMAMELMYVVNGSPAIMAQAVQGLVQRSGQGWIEIVESTADQATVIGHREGRPDMTITWTKQMAEAAGSKSIGGWTDKLVWKAIARAGRRMFPDVLGGLDVGDGGGEIIDRLVVPEQEGEYKIEDRAPQAAIEGPRVADSAPSIEEPKPEQTIKEQLIATLKDRSLKADLVLAYLTARSGRQLEKTELLTEIGKYMDATGCTVADVVTDAQAYDEEQKAMPAEMFDSDAPAQEAVESPTAAEMPEDMFATA